MKGGFHTRQDIKSSLAKPKQELGVSYARELGHAAVAHLNPNAKCPNMQPTGCEDLPEKEDLDVYVLAGAPTMREDATGQAWGHEDATPYKAALRGLRTRWGHVCRTAVPGNLPPEPIQLEAYRNAVEQDIESYRPRVILACGHRAFEFFQPNIAPTLKGNVELHRGRAFPVRVGSHECWLYVTVDSVQRKEYLENGSKSCRDPSEWELHLNADLRAVTKLVKGKRAKVYPSSVSGLLGLVGTHSMPVTPEAVLRELTSFRKSLRPKEDVALDWETLGIRPYSKTSAVRTCALRSGDRAIAFPVDHPSCKFSKEQRHELLDLIWEILEGRPILVHRLEFECEWAIFLLGDAVARAPLWDCTFAQAYILGARQTKQAKDRADPEVVGLSLDYLCRMHLGIGLKALSGDDAYHEDRPLAETLQYNLLDSIATYELFWAQNTLIEEQDLSFIYREQVRRAPTVVLAQWQGLPASQEERKRLEGQFAEESRSIEEELLELPEIQDFEKNFGKFNPSSEEDIKKMFDSILGIKITSTDADTLQKYEDTSYAAKYIVSLRKKAKLLSTYVRPFQPGHEKSVIWDDGLVHCQINTCRTVTGRTSAQDPNTQNWPKRDEAAKEVRGIIAAPPGWIFVAADYGQIEARVLGMAARDRVFLEMLRNDYDVHMDWAERWARLIGTKLEIKKLRSVIKNKVVFPWFFGAGVESVARNMGADPDLVRVLNGEFREVFAESFAWHRRIDTEYKRTGYVETLTGRRRYGPLTFNMKVNMPIQGTASDIVMDAFNRISEDAYKMGRPELAPRLVIHDDLTFLLPEKDLDYAAEFVGSRMVDCPFEFVNVPLTVEMEIGTDLANMSPLKKFKSDPKDKAWQKNQKR